MNTKNEISNALALFATGLLAGTFFYVKFNIMPTFWEVPMDVHLRFRFTLMKHNDVLFQSLIAFSTLSSAFFAYRIRKYKHLFVIACFSVLLSIITFLITYFGNMPINDQIRTWLQVSPPNDWADILQTWDFYHSSRTVISMLSFILILMTNFFEKQIIKKKY